MPFCWGDGALYNRTSCTAYSAALQAHMGYLYIPAAALISLYYGQIVCHSEQEKLYHLWYLMEHEHTLPTPIYCY